MQLVEIIKYNQAVTAPTIKIFDEVDTAVVGPTMIHKDHSATTNIDKSKLKPPTLPLA